MLTIKQRKNLIKLKSYLQSVDRFDRGQNFNFCVYLVAKEAGFKTRIKLTTPEAIKTFVIDTFSDDFRFKGIIYCFPDSYTLIHCIDDVLKKNEE
jgi:hypothetical protein